MSTQASTTPNQGILPDDRPRGLGTLLTPSILLLAGLLVIQLLLALGIGWSGRDLGETAAGTPLMPFDPEQVTRLEIIQTGQDPVALDRRDEGWVLGGLADFPAADSQVEELLTKLSGLERRLPIATSDDAMERFRVTDDVYERKMVATARDGATTELLFGDSPGFRRIFVRPAGETAVYEVPLAVSDISGKVDDWTDKDLLKLTADEIREIRLPGLALNHGDQGWQLLDAGQQESLDTEKVDQLIRTLSSLSFNSVRSAPQDDSDSDQDPESVMDFQLTLDGDKELDYRLTKTVDGEHILMSSSQPDRFFVISQYQAQQLQEQNRAGLLRLPEQAPDQKPSSQDEHSGPVDRNNTEDVPKNGATSTQDEQETD